MIAHLHPDALLVRVRALVLRIRLVVAAWLVAHAVALVGAALGVWLAAAFGWTVRWGWAGSAAAALVGCVAAVGIDTWWRPVTAWIQARLVQPAWAWAGRRWVRLRVRVTGRGGPAAGYVPFHPERAPDDPTGRTNDRHDAHPDDQR